MALFKKILYPTDFSEKSIAAMSLAIELAQVSNSELFILYSYRLNGGSDNFRAKISFKNDKDEKATELFKSVDENVLSTSGIEYSLLSEVGFIGDRIVSNVDSHQVDLLILSKEIQEQLHITQAMENGIIPPEVSCSVLLLSEYSQ